MQLGKTLCSLFLLSFWLLTIFKVPEIFATANQFKAGYVKLSSNEM